MATIKITDLPAGGSTLSSNDVFPVVDSGTNTTKKVTLQNIENYISNNIVVDGSIDSAGTISLITQTVDSDYVAARVGDIDAGIDSAATVAIVTSTVDSDYINARVEPFTDSFLNTKTVINTNPDVYDDNGFNGPDGRGGVDPNGKGGWYWESPGGTGTDRSIAWRMFTNDGPQTFTVADIEYLYMVVDLQATGDVFFNIYTAGLNPAPSAFRSRFNFALNGAHSDTGLKLLWAAPPGSSVTEADVDVFPFLERVQLPYQAALSSGDLNVTEVLKSVNIMTSTSAAAGDVEFTLKNVGYKINTGYTQNFDLITAPDPAKIDASLLDFSNVQDSAGGVQEGFIYREADGTIKVKVAVQTQTFNANGALETEVSEVVGSGTQTQAGLRPKHAFILAGQSNMVGRANFDNGTVHPANVYQFNQSNQLVAPTVPLDHRDDNSGDMGLDISFAEAYMAANPNVDLVLIPCADGGTGFSRSNWNPGNTVYEAMVTRTAAAFAAYPDMELKGFLWHQGEADKSASDRAVWPDRWNTMIDDFIARSVMTTDTPVVVGGLFENDANAIAMSGVIQGVADARDYATFVDASDMTSFDNLHFDAASLRVLGGRYYTQWVAAQTDSNVDSRLETGAQAHWLFGSDNAAREDLVSGQVASVTIPLAATASNYVETAEAIVGSGLDTGIAGGQPEQTVIIVHQRISTNNVIIAGNLKAAGSGDGQALFIGSNVFRWNDRSGIGMNDIENPYSPTNSEWVFTAYSYSNTGANAPLADVILYSSRSGGPIVVTNSGNVRLTNTDNIGLGNLHYDGGTAFEDGHRFAEAIIFDRALSQAEIEAVFQRSGERMEDRGISLLGYDGTLEVKSGSGALSAQSSTVDATIDFTSSVPVDPRLETGAQAHWIFGSDNASRTDLASSRVALGTPAATGSNYIETDTAKQSGLDTQIAGSSEQTIMVVSQRTSSSGNIIQFGNLKTASEGAGRAVFIGGGRQRFNDRNGLTFVEMEDPYSPSNSDWVFTAYSYTNTGTNAPNADVLTYTSRSGGALVNTKTGTAVNTNTDNIGIGNLTYNATGFDASHRFAEVIIFDRALTVQELNEVFLRSGARMADRGISLLGYTDGGIAVSKPTGLDVTIPTQFDIRRSGNVYYLNNYDAQAHAGVTFNNDAIYVDSINGDDANNGLTDAAPKRTLSAAQALAPSRIYLAYGSTFQKNERTADVNFSTEIIAYGDDTLDYPRITAMQNNRVGTWTQTNNYYSTVMPDFVGVVRDLNVDDGVGGKLGMTQVSTINDVNTTPGSWFLDWGGAEGPAQTLYLRFADDRTPVGDTNYELHDNLTLRIRGSNRTVYFKNIEIDRQLQCRGEGGIRIFMDECIGAYTAWGADEFVVNGGIMRSFGGDAMNIDDYNGTTGNVYEINVDATNYGAGGSSDQASTSHNTSNVVRIGGYYHDTSGQVIADVQATGETWMMGCTLENSGTNIGAYLQVEAFLERNTFIGFTTDIQVAGGGTTYYLDNTSTPNSLQVENNGTYLPYP